MFGNCATGKLSMVMAPTITKTMEITMATMGRLIKNFDMGLFSLRLCDERLGIHLHAVTYFLYPFGNHAFALFQSVRNNPLGPNGFADFDGADAHLVLIVHDRNLIAPLQLRDGTLRYKQRIRLVADNRANLAITAGPQNISGIGEQPGDANCAGAHVDLAICEVEAALVRIIRAVRQNQLEAQILVGLRPR